MKKVKVTLEIELADKAVGFKIVPTSNGKDLQGKNSVILAGERRDRDVFGQGCSWNCTNTVRLADNA